jgi:hypothetical protein
MSSWSCYGNYNETCLNQTGLELWCLTPLSTIFKLYRGSVLLMEEPRVPGENHRTVASHSLSDKLYLIMLYRVHIKLVFSCVTVCSLAVGHNLNADRQKVWRDQRSNQKLQIEHKQTIHNHWRLNNTYPTKKTIVNSGAQES